MSDTAVVTGPVVTAPPPPPPPASDAPVDKSAEQIANLNIALQEARKELSGYKKTEAEKAQQEAIAKGDFEKVLTERDTKLAELTGLYEQSSGKIAEYETILNKDFEDRLSKLDKDQKSFYDEMMSSGLVQDTLATKTALLSQALKISPKAQPFGQTPSGQKPDVDLSKKAELDSAIKRGDTNAIWALHQGK